MAQYDELVEALIWLLTNRVQNKINYSHGLLGDGQGRVRVAGNEDFVYARPDRFSSRTQQIFNKRVEGQDGDPIIIGELPWEPGLTQVISIDWRTYKEIGWGGDTTGFTYHGRTHIWKDAAPGLDTFPVYRRQLGDLQATASVSGTNAIDISSYSIELYGAQKQFPGTIGFPLDNAVPAGTGTARMALLYWDPSSGTTGYVGVATGTTGIDSESTLLNRPVSLPGTLPIAFVRLKAGQAGVTEFDIFDAREPFRPGIGFGTGSSQFHAGLIPIADVGGFYTGSSVESALQEIGGGSLPGNTFKVSELWESDFGAVAWQTDAGGNLANVDGETLTLNDSTPTIRTLLSPGTPTTAAVFTSYDEIGDARFIIASGTDASAASTIQLFDQAGETRFLMDSDGNLVGRDDGGNARIDWSTGLAVGDATLTLSDTVGDKIVLSSNGIIQANEVTNLIDTSYLGLSGGNSLNNGANIELYGGTHATLANRTYYDADLHTFRARAGTPTKFIINHTSNYSRFFHNVGIGAIPQRLLHVGPGTDAPFAAYEGVYVAIDGIAQIAIRNNTDNVEGGMFAHSNLNFYMGSWTNHEVHIRQNNADAIIIDTSRRVGIGGAPVTSTILTLTSTTGALLLPRMTTIQRDALTAVDGMILFNSTTGKIEGREGGAWVDI